MLLEQEAFQLLNPSYQKVMENLQKEYHKIPENAYSEKRKLLNKFSKQYFLPKELWKKWFDLFDQEEAESQTWDLIKEKDEASNKGLFQFYYSERAQIFTDLHLLNHKKKFHHEYQKIYTIREVENIENFSYPHGTLKRRLRFYQEESSSPVSKEILCKYKKMKKLYKSILEAENSDDKEWFSLIIQAENNTFIYNNVEYRLGKNLNNIDLWKMYIQFLKHHDTKKLLSIYSLYCRYFLDDMEMKKEYKIATEKYGPSFVDWENPFVFETPKQNQSFPCSDQNVSQNLSPKNLIKASFDNYQPQNFSIPKSIIFYIIQEIQKYPEILHKLHKSCKYFYFTKMNPVFHNLFCKMLSQEIGIEFYKQSAGIYCTHEDTNLVFNHKPIIISNALHVNGPSPIFVSNLIPNVLYFHIKFLRLRFQHFTLEEFKILVKEKELIALQLQDVNINDDKNETVGIEEILKLIPKIKEFEMHSPTVNPSTFESLLEMNFGNKIDIFNLYDVSYLEPNNFCEFLKKNFDEDSEIIVRFNFPAENIISVVETEIASSLWPNKPIISIA